MLTTFDDDDYVYGALRAGASGFLVKDMALDDILAAIRVVAAGDALIAPSVTRRLIEEFARPGRGTALLRSTATGGWTHHRPRAGGADPGRPRPVQRRDRRGTVHQRRPPPRPMWRGCSPSSTPGTGCSWSSRRMN